MKRVILFDVDGVLLHGESFAVSLEKDYGISYEMLQPFFTGPFLQSSIGQKDMREIIEPYLSEWKWHSTFEDFIAYWFKAEHQSDEKLIAYIRQLRQKGTLCYLATNQEKYRTDYILKNIGFENEFDGVFASFELGAVKPDIAFFERLDEKLPSVDKSEMLFWDDTEKNVAAARTYGIAAELYTNFASFVSVMESTYA